MKNSINIAEIGQTVYELYLNVGQQMQQANVQANVQFNKYC